MKCLFLTLFFFCFIGCAPDNSDPIDRTCDEEGCVCNEGLTACGDDCVDLQSNTEHCGGCDANVLDAGASDCRSGVPVCATSAELCQEPTPVCSDFGCREEPTFDCDPNASLCTDARICDFNNFDNVYECVRQECLDDLDCDAFGAVCIDDECVSG